jgi:hypothetical protein
VSVIHLKEDKNSGNVNKGNCGEEGDAEESKGGTDVYKDADDSKDATVGDMVEE